jgi:copper(I)-binding protein
MRKVRSLLGIAGAVLLAALGVSACSAAGSASSISIPTAYVPQATSHGDTVAYLDIRNNGRADRLIAAHTSVGGTVLLRAPEVGPASVLTMHTVSEIPIPPDSLVRLDPDSSYLQITGAGPMQDGKAITLTLTFANAGTITVLAVVTNPQDGGSSYFLN